MPKISQIFAREIIDSRATPTVEVMLRLDTGQTVLASVPSGTSTGKHEAVEIRDGDPKRFLGKGVLKAIENINEKITPAIIGMDTTSQFEIDRKMIEMDGTENKSNFGANSILAVSCAVCKAAALASGVALYRWVGQLAQAAQVGNEEVPTRIPTPIFNLINGGLHGAGNLDFQEFQVIPATSKPYHLALQTTIEVYYHLGESLKRRGAISSVGDEGGFAPNLFTNADALEVNVEAITQSGYQIGQDFFLGLDVAANTFYKDGGYSIKDSANSMNTSTLISFFEKLNQNYRLVYLEDPLQEEDWNGWRELTAKLGEKMMVVGDDLLATNPERVKKAIEEKVANSALIKPNQIGTVTQTLEVIKLCRTAGWKIIISHRSGETNDWFIADFAVGVNSDFIKFGAPARGERVAKYNRLLAIEQELNIMKE